MNFLMIVIALFSAAVLAACGERGAVSGVFSSTKASTNTVTASPSPEQPINFNPSPTLTPTNPLEPRDTSTPTGDFDTLTCSPLQGIPMDQIPETITNPFAPPPPGSDNPHQGIDLSDINASQGIALAGRQVNAVIAGKVAMVISERFPYGNAVLIETPIEELSPGLISVLPTPAPMQPANPALTCPTDIPLPNWSAEQRSLYILYAHLQSVDEFEIGERLGCGERIGSVGSSGNALNPHLHLESRLGPAGMRLISMAHYDTSSSQEEMHSYCIWRVSGWFQLLDPSIILSIAPSRP
jgi:murein DD-endopeptidase MepM/ murein hydrolase activator NlpD